MNEYYKVKLNWYNTHEVRLMWKMLKNHYSMFFKNREKRKNNKNKKQKRSDQGCLTISRIDVK